MTVRWKMFHNQPVQMKLIHRLIIAMYLKTVIFKHICVDTVWKSDHLSYCRVETKSDQVNNLW